ncbi:MAG: dihydropyrimidinase [Eubacteriales bacterium]|nr:dihydropyrimidinase [Eubacteriales bacterium]
MKLLIINGTVVTEGEVFSGDVLVEDEKIKAIGRFPDETADEIIDADGMYVMPGAIDPHTHMELQQSKKYRACDDFYDGTVAAACGGTTMIIDHMAFGPNGCSLHTPFETYRELAKKSVIDYSFHGVFQRVDDQVLNELEQIVTMEGFPSFKAYTTYGYPMFDRELMAILRVMKRTGGLLTVHSENDAVTNVLRERFAAEGKTAPIYQALSRPNEAEAEAVEREIYLARIEDDAPLYIVHLSAKESLRAVKNARAMGQRNIFVETCTQYLTLTDRLFEEGGPEKGILYMLAPPLRKQADIDELWEGVANGDIQVIATDHCPFLPHEKLENVHDYRTCPGGISGVEERVRIVFSEGVQKGRISPERFVEVISTNAAKIFGMYPRKGCLLPGSDADIMIINPNKSMTISKNNLHTKAGYSPFEGWQVNCVIDTVICRGRVVARENRFVGDRGYGKLIPRENNHLDNMVLNKRYI